MNDATHGALTAHLDSVEGLIGHSTEGALRTLLRLEVRQAFDVVGREFDAGVLENDEFLARIVDRALVVRVAVARRWEVSGASSTERRLAAEVDRVLDNRSAVLMVDGTEGWLADLAGCLEFDYASWWGFQASPRWVALGPAIEAAVAPKPVVRPSREEVAGDEEHGWFNGWEAFVIKHERTEDALADWVCAQHPEW